MEKKSIEGFVVQEHSEQQKGLNKCMGRLRETLSSVTTKFEDLRENIKGRSMEEILKLFINFSQGVKEETSSVFDDVTDDVKSYYTEADCQAITQEKEKERAKYETLVVQSAYVMVSTIEAICHLFLDVLDFVGKLWNWIKSCAKDIYEKITCFIQWLKDAYLKFFK